MSATGTGAASATQTRSVQLQASDPRDSGISDATKEGAQESPFDLALLTKYGAVSGALAYTTGMIAVNTYLHQLGITDFSFAKPKLILSGALVLLSFLLLALLPLCLAVRMTRLPGVEGRSLSFFAKRLLLPLHIPLLALLAVSACMCFGKIGLGQVAIWQVWQFIHPRNRFTESLASLIIAGLVYAPVSIAALSAFLAARMFARAKSAARRSRISAEWAFIPITLVAFVVSLFAYVYMFALTFYPAIPQALGGGKPYLEGFVIADNQRCQVQHLGIPFEAGKPNVTVPLPVLHESDTLVAVWLHTSKDVGASTVDLESWRPVVLQLDKSQMIGVVASPLEKPGAINAAPPLPCATDLGSGATLANR
jgi:hypothetical protein